MAGGAGRQRYWKPQGEPGPRSLPAAGRGPGRAEATPSVASRASGEAARVGGKTRAATLEVLSRLLEVAATGLGLLFSYR